MYHCIEYLYSYGKVFRTIVADNGAISQGKAPLKPILSTTVITFGTETDC